MKRAVRVPRGLILTAIVVLSTAVVLSVLSPGARPVIAQEEQPTPTPSVLYNVGLTRELAAGGDVDGDGVVDPGDTLRYTVTVTNGSPQGSGPVEVVVRLDSTLVGAVTNISEGGAQGAGGEVVWSFDDIAGGETVTAGFDAALATRLPSGRSQLASTAIVRSPEGVELARGSTLPLEVVGPILKLNDMRFELVTDANDSGRLDAGDIVRLIVAYSNTGAAPSQDATVVSDYPEDLVAHIIGNPNEGLDDGSTMSWTIGSVPADGETRELQYDVQLQGLFPAGVTSLPVATEIRSGGVVRDSSELEISVSGASFAIETELAFTLDQDADRRGDNGDEVEFSITVSNIGDEPATAVTLLADYNERFVTATGASSEGQIDAEAGTVTWTVPEVGAGQRVTETLDLEIGSVPEGLPVVNTGFRVESPDAQPAELQRGIQLDTELAPAPTPSGSQNVIEERPAQGSGILSAFTVGVLLGSFLFLSLLSIAYVGSRVLGGEPADTEEERSAQRRLVRELIEGVVLALILFSVMVLGLQNALDQDSVNSIIAGIVGYVAGRVASQR